MTTAASTVVGRVDADEQRLLVADLREIVAAAPLVTPVAGGQAMSVRITNAGPWGWLATAERGYHYSDRHPVTGKPWPPILQRWLDLADRFRDHDDDGPALPWDCAHVVVYPPGASLGWHRDKTEHDLRGQVITISLGDPAEWWVEHDELDKSSITLETGDVVRLSGESRNVLHRISKVHAADSGSLFNPSPLPKPGRAAISIRSGAGPR